MARIVSDVGDDRFGPNTKAVEAFLEKLRRLTPQQWDHVIKASPIVGSVPILEVKEAPAYFAAIDAATRIAKSDVFPGSESAFYDAMRTAQQVADASARLPSRRTEPAASAVAEGQQVSPEAEADQLSELMMTAYEEESWRRAMNASMVAAGALVVRKWLADKAFTQLIQPLSDVLSLK
jgi:hypothetical protein